MHLYGSEKMSKFFLYADPHSQAILAEDSEKLLLIGGDFGYGNFGDVLQHANALDFAKKNKRYRKVSVFNTEVISSPEFPAWARSNYQTDAIIFVSGVPHVFRDAVPGIDPVQVIRGLSFMWMYGGLLPRRWRNGGDAWSLRRLRRRSGFSSRISRISFRRNSGT